MKQWPEHSLYGYFTRLPTYKLELILDMQHKAAENNLLQPKDYEFIRQILQTRSDSKLFLRKQLQNTVKIIPTNSGICEHCRGSLDDQSCKEIPVAVFIDTDCHNQSADWFRNDGENT